MNQELLFGTLAYLFTPYTIFSIAGMIIVPAKQRVIFASAFYFVCAVFIQIIIYIVVPRFVMSRIGTQWLESFAETAWLVARHQHAEQISRTEL